MHQADADKPGMFRCDEASPAEHGWYAVMLCYDSEEGVLPGTAEWTGSWSLGSELIGWVNTHFKTQEEAQRFATKYGEDW